MIHQPDNRTDRLLAGVLPSEAHSAGYDTADRTHLEGCKAPTRIGTRVKGLPLCIAWLSADVGACKTLQVNQMQCTSGQVHDQTGYMWTDQRHLMAVWMNGS